MNKTSNKYLITCIYLALIIAPLAAFWQVLNCDFVDYDDNKYVTENSHVSTGLTWDNCLRAFTSTHFFMWHPMTSLSHILDCELFGLKAGWHHLTNLIFHIANTLLLFGILKRITGRIWPSAFVAAVFALHPINVESVAWVCERKNVLSCFFWMLTIAAYIRYAEHPRITNYLLVILVFSLGLMSKPMVVTLPFVLLLLDYWPLCRFQWEVQDKSKRLPQLKSLEVNYKKLSTWQLVKEKIPLTLLAAILCIITVTTTKSGNALFLNEYLPFGVRSANALVSYVSYIGKMFYPSHLSVFYPHPRYNLPAWKPIVSFVVLAAISAATIHRGRHKAYLIAGWFWYLGTLVPVIGFIQAGEQAMADRYAYIPFVGLFVIIAWGISDLSEKWRHRKSVLGVASLAILVSLSVCTWFQVRYWYSTETLFNHALEATEDNYVAHYTLALCQYKQGKPDQAIGLYAEALRINPDYTIAHVALGAALIQLGRLNEAIDHFDQALQLNPDLAEAHYNLGVTLISQGKTDQAITHLRRAIQISTDDAKAYNNLGVLLYMKGQYDEATSNFQQAIQLRPAYAEAHSNLGTVLSAQGKFDEALSHFRQALQLKPDLAGALNGMAKILATHPNPKVRNASEAVKFAEQAAELTKHQDPKILDTLAAAYAAAGRSDKAATTAQKALTLAVAAKNNELADQIRKKLELYTQTKTK